MGTDQRLRVGMIGAGEIAVPHAQGWRSLGAQLSVHSLKGADELAARFGGTAHHDLSELLGRCDIIDVVTPTPEHADYVAISLRAGKHVVCEKPLARSSSQARSLVELSANAPGRLFVAHVVRYFPEYAQLHAAVAAGRIGPPAVLRFSRAGAAPGKDWFFSLAQSGGIILDQSIHDIDQALWIAGPVRRVYACTNPTLVAANRDASLSVPLVANITLEHSGGAISQITSIWGNPGLRFRTAFSVSGPDGTLKHDSSWQRQIRVLDVAAEADAGYLPPGDPTASPYTAQLVDFVHSIRTGSQPRVTVEDACVAVEVAEAALESASSGQAVTLSTPAVTR